MNVQWEGRMTGLVFSGKSNSWCCAKDKRAWRLRCSRSAIAPYDLKMGVFSLCPSWVSHPGRGRSVQGASQPSGRLSPASPCVRRVWTTRGWAGVDFLSPVHRTVTDGAFWTAAQAERDDWDSQAGPWRIQTVTSASACVWGWGNQDIWVTLCLDFRLWAVCLYRDTDVGCKKILQKKK